MIDGVGPLAWIPPPFRQRGLVLSNVSPPRHDESEFPARYLWNATRRV